MFLNAHLHIFWKSEIKGLFLNNTIVDFFFYYETVVRYYETESRVQTPARDNIFNTIVVVVSVDVLPEFCNLLLTIVPWHVLRQSLEALAQTISSHA